MENDKTLLCSLLYLGPLLSLIFINDPSLGA